LPIFTRFGKKTIPWNIRTTCKFYKLRFPKFVLKYRECIKQKKNTQQATGYVAEIAREQTSNLFDHFIKWISYKQWLDTTLWLKIKSSSCESCAMTETWNYILLCLCLCPGLIQTVRNDVKTATYHTVPKTNHHPKSSRSDFVLLLCKEAIADHPSIFKLCIKISWIRCNWLRRV
jgi:hypothetical protein